MQQKSIYLTTGNRAMAGNAGRYLFLSSPGSGTRLPATETSFRLFSPDRQREQPLGVNDCRHARSTPHRKLEIHAQRLKKQGSCSPLAKLTKYRTQYRTPREPYLRPLCLQARTINTPQHRPPTQPNTLPFLPSLTLLSNPSTMASPWAFTALPPLPPPSSPTPSSTTPPPPPPT